MDFQVFHDYNKLVRRGLAEPLRCSACGAEPVLGIDARSKEIQPLFKCYHCGALTSPGLNVYDACRDKVKEIMG